MVNINTKSLNQDEAFSDFCASLTTLSTPQAEKLLTEILTPDEKKDIANRWAILYDLSQVIPQRETAGRLGVSLAKVARMSAIYKNPASLSRLLVQQKTDK